MRDREPLKTVLRPLYHRVYRAGVRARCWWLDTGEKLNGNALVPPAPPALLRFRVAEDADLQRFLDAGQLACQSLESHLQRLGRGLDGFRRVLDFGCGCGRILRWLVARYPGQHFFGTDVDREAIAWCRTHLPAAGFQVNDPLPPLAYADHAFDLICGLSVFTHLDAQFHARWLPELARVLDPGGLLFLTFHGPAAWRALPPRRRTEIEQHRFLFTTSRKLRGIVPDWYHTAYHTPAYVLDLLAQHFQILDYVPAGFGYQDVAIVQKLPADGRQSGESAIGSDR